MPKDYTPAMDCTGQQRPFIELRPVESSQIAAYGYDAASQTLALQFKGKNASIYHYPNFTEDQHQAFINAESLGKHFGTHIAKLPSQKFAPESVAA